MRPQNKVLVVTGAGSGMGRELSLQLIQRGARVVGLDVSQKGLEETASRLPAQDTAKFLPVRLDITQRAEVEAVADTVARTWGAVDGLINCAGIIQPFVTVADLDYATIERVFQVNWWGMLYLTKTFLPQLLARPEAHIVNISSMGGFLPVPGQSVYGASKAAVKLLTEALFSELADTSVRVTVVFPGAIATNIATNSGVANPGNPEAQKARTYPADRAASDILRAMEQNRYRVTVGFDSWLVDLMYRCSPRRAARFIAGLLRGLLSKSPQSGPHPGGAQAPDR